MIPESFKADVDTILDCFTGADGGLSFVMLGMFLRDCEQQGVDVVCVRQFARLIRVLEKPLPKKE